MEKLDETLDEAKGTCAPAGEAPREKSRYAYIGMVFLQSVLYGILDPVTKLALRSMPVYSFLTLRFTLAAGIMLLLWGKRIVRELKRAPVGAYITPGVCMALVVILTNLALQHTAATNVAFLRSLSALFAPALVCIVLKKRYTLRDLVLQAAVLLGLYLLCAKGGLSGFGAGEALALLAALTAAGALVFGQQALGAVGAITLTFVQSAVAIVICGAMGAFTHSFSNLAPPSLPVVAALCYAAAFGTVGGCLLQNIALGHISAKLVGMTQSLYPIIVAAVAFVLLGERLSLMGIVGAAIIAACVFLESFLKE